MKTLNEYLSLPYRLEILPDPQEGGYVGILPELPGCMTTANDIDALMHNIEDAKRAWLEAALQDGLAIPEPQSLRDYSGQFKLRLPKSLHQQLAEHAKQEGVSMNQYCVYLLTQQDARFTTKHVS